MQSDAELEAFVADRHGHERRGAIDPGRLVDELCRRPAHPLEQGLRSRVRRYLESSAQRRAVQRRSGRERPGLPAGARA